MLTFLAFSRVQMSYCSDGAFTTIFLDWPYPAHSSRAYSFNSSTLLAYWMSWQALRVAVATNQAIFPTPSLRSILTTNTILQSSSSSQKPSSSSALSSPSSSILPDLSFRRHSLGYYGNNQVLLLGGGCWCYIGGLLLIN